MAYTLTPTQSRAFVQLFDLYKQVENPPRTGTTKTSNGVYYQLVYANVRGRIAQAPSVTAPSRIGRGENDMVYTYDVLRLHSDQEFDDGWMAREVATDQWYTTQGTDQVRIFRAKEATYKVARTEAPSMVSNSVPN